MNRILIGGSPCTYWSIAQTKGRETEPSGMGWELFENYLIALDKYKPNYFLYENNKSMSKAIREEISKRFGFEPVCINSALVSAQSRQRLYWVGRRPNKGSYRPVQIDQPADRGILLRDILESGVCWREKAYTLDSNYFKTLGRNVGFDTQAGRRKMVAEPVNVTADGKARCLRASCHKDGIRNLVGNTVDRKTCAAEPVRIGTIENDASNADYDSQQYRVYGPDAKSVTLCGQGGGMGAKTGLYAAPVRIGAINGGSQGNRIYSVDGKAISQTAAGGGIGSNTGLYAVPCMRVPEATRQGYVDIYPGECVDLAQENSKTRRGRRMAEKTNCLTTSCSMYEYCGTLDKPIYQVKDGYITINGQRWPIKLRDGCYIIRKLTVTECKRLQTVPDAYIFPVSDTQAYKMLGNGWTVDVIRHIMSHFDGITAGPVEVLSMYDGMSCGHIALDKLGANVVRYYATEIDKYAIQTTQHNYPNTIQLGDAFQVREDGWRLEGV